MFLKLASQRIRGIILNPKQEWEIILHERKENFIATFCIYYLGAYLIAGLFGKILFTTDLPIDIKRISLQLVSNLVILLCMLFFSKILVINTLKHKEIAISNYIINKLIFYSMMPYTMALLITTLLSNYKALSKFILFLGCYGIILFYLGIGKHIKMDQKDKQRLVLMVSLFVIIFVVICNYVIKAFIL